MKRFSAFIVALCAFAALGASHVMAADAPLVTVSGQGQINQAPDIAYITIGVSIEKTKAADAQAENADISAAVVKAVKGLGIKDDNIKTNYYNVSPKYNYNKSPYTLTGYTVTNSIKVTVRNLDLVSKIVDAAVQNGATNISGISFGIEDTTKAYGDALKLAYNNAYDKAAKIAAASGYKTITLNSVSEGYSNYTPVYKEASYAAGAAMADSAPTAIYSEDVGVSANLTVVFELSK